MRTRLSALFRSKTPGGWLVTFAVYALALTWLYPFAWMVTASLKALLK